MPSSSKLFALLAALALLAAACSSDATEETAETETTDAPSEEVVEEEPETTTTTEAATTTEATEPEPEPEPEGFEAVTAAVDAFVTDRGLNGAALVIVERGTGTIYEEYFGEFGPDRISLIASSSKMISSGVLLHLQQEGLLDIDAPVADQVDWAVGNPDITPAMLVSNSSGFVGLGPDIGYVPYFCQWSPATDLQACATTVFTTADDDADQIPPDTEFRYGGAQWQVAGAVAESVSGKTWDELIEEIYVEPCGVHSLGYINLAVVFTGDPGYPTVFGGGPEAALPSDNPTIEGGAHITAADYATLLQMHLDGGVCGDNEIFSQDSLDIMHTDRVAAAYDGDAGDADTGYGLGWWVDRDTGRISDGGAWGTVPWMDLDDGYAAYLVIEDESDTGQELKRSIEELVHDAVLGA